MFILRYMANPIAWVREIMLRYLRVGRMWCFPSTHYVLFKWHFPVHGRPCLQSVIHEVHEIFVVRGRGAWEGISLDIAKRLAITPESAISCFEAKRAGRGTGRKASWRCSAAVAGRSWRSTGAITSRRPATRHMRAGSEETSSWGHKNRVSNMLES